MDFWNFPDFYSFWQKHQDKTNEQFKDYREFYHHMQTIISKRRDVMSIKSFFNQLIAQELWHFNGKPYFKIYPAMVGILSNTRITIPTDYLTSPISSFCIRLPNNNDNPMREGPNYPTLRSILVSCTNSLDIIDGKLQETSLRVLTVWMDFGETSKDELTTPIYTYLNIPLESGKTVEEILEWAIGHQEPKPEFLSNEEYGYICSPEFNHKIMALITAATFLIAGKGREHPDIAARYKDRWIKATKSSNNTEKKTILQKSRELGYHGWRIGEEIEREIRLSNPKPDESHESHESHNSRHKKYEHKFRHWRGWYMNYYWVGSKENRHLEARLIDGQWIRDDLPMPVGYVLKDRL